MKTRKLGRTGRMVGEIGMGTEHLLDKDEQTVARTIRSAIEGGVTYIDCHPGHDISFETDTYEGYAKLGKALSPFDRDVLCLTYLAGASFTAAQTAPRFEHFLEAMGLHYIDVFILQFCDKVADYDRITGKDSLLTFARELQAAGKARYIGISTHSAAVAIKAIDSGAFDVLMYPVNPAFDVVSDEEIYRTDKLETLWDAAHDFTAKGKTGAQPRKDVYGECLRKDVALVAMKPFAGGFIFGVEEAAGFTPVGLIAYALAQNGVSTVVPGCTKPGEIEDILTYSDCTPEARDYSAAVANSRWSVMQNCLYCNHCLPCPADINIAEVNRMLDAEDREGYRALAVKASECLKCGVCEERCPFEVQVRERMRKAAEVFESRA